MDVERFLDLLPKQWAGDPQTADAPLDPRFGAIDVPGLSTPNVLAVLNLAASLLEEDECYVEVGTYRGLTLVGASLGQEATFYGVDNFSEWGGDEATCRKYLAEQGCGPNVHLVVGDAWRVLASPPWKERIGVFFYDGRHRGRDQLRAFVAARRLLADRALVIIDDASQRPVRLANELARLLPGFRQLTRFDSRFNGDPRWWNGLTIFGFSRS